MLNVQLEQHTVLCPLSKSHSVITYSPLHRQTLEKLPESRIVTADLLYKLQYRYTQYIKTNQITPLGATIKFTVRDNFIVMYFMLLPHYKVILSTTDIFLKMCILQCQLTSHTYRFGSWVKKKAQYVQNLDLSSSQRLKGGWVSGGENPFNNMYMYAGTRLCEGATHSIHSTLCLHLLCTVPFCIEGFKPLWRREGTDNVLTGSRQKNFHIVFK